MAAKSKELRVELTAGVKGFQKGFKEAEGIAEDWGQKIGSSFAMIATPAGLASLGIGAVTAGLAAVVTAAAATAAGIAYATKATLEYADSLDTISQRSGHTTDWLQEMQYAVGQSSTDMETLTAASTKLRNVLGEGSADTADSVRDLGLSFEELKDAAPDEQINRVLKSLSQIEDPVTRTTLATNLLGKSGEQLVPLGRNLDALKDKAHVLGVVMAEEDVTAAAALKNEIRSVSDAFDGTVRSIGAAITSNESLHIAVAGLDEVFGTLTGAVNENRSGLQSLVSGGVVLLVKGLQVVAEAMLAGNAVYSGLAIAWNRLDVAATKLAIGFLQVKSAKEALTGNDVAVEQAQAGIKALEAESKALQNHEGELIAQGANRKEAIEKTKAQLADLERAVSAAAGKEIKLKGGKDGSGIDVDLDEAARLRKEAAERAKADRDAKRSEAERLRAMEDRYEKSKLFMDNEAEREDEGRREAIAADEEARQINLDASRAYYDDLDRLDALDEEAARRRDQETYEAKRAQIADIFDAVFALGDIADSLGFGKLGGQIQGAVRWTDQLGAAIEDGTLSWGEMFSLAAGAIEGIKNTFSKPKWQKLADGVGKRWGVKIGDELAKQIEEDSNRLGDNVAAMLSSLPAIIEEAGGIGSFGFDKAAAGAHDLFSMIETGKLTVAEAGETFDEVFGQMLPEALDSVTGLAKDSFLELIELDKRFGTNSKNVRAFMESQNSALMKGLEAVTKGGKITEKSAAGVAASVVIAYKQLREQGVSARDALSQMAPSIDELRAKLEALGVGGGAAFDLLAQQSALYADETAGPLLEAINGAGEAIAALYNMNALTEESFAGLTASIADTYAELVATGQAGPAAMQAIAPDLQRVWELQQKTGFAVDAATQALLDEAVAAGLVGEAHVSAQDKMAESAERLNVILEAIAKSMGIDIPAAAQQAADGVNDAFSKINPPDLNGSYSYTGSGVPTEALPQFKLGGIGDFGSGAPAMLHGREWIIPEDRIPGLLSKGSGAQIAIDARSMLDPSQNFESERRQNERVAKTAADSVVRSLSRALAADLA